MTAPPPGLRPDGREAPVCPDTDATAGREPFDAVVLAGGAARRLGGVDKAGLDVGGAPLLDRVLDALAAARRVVVVGRRRPTRRAVTWLLEDPPGGGPAAALAAGLAAVDAPWTAVLAADLPFLRVGTVEALLRAADGHDGAVLVDDEGREQLLVGVWSTPALHEAVRRRPQIGGSSMRVLLDGLSRAHVRPDAGAPDDWFDCDTDDDLRRARERATSS